MISKYNSIWFIVRKIASYSNQRNLHTINGGAMGVFSAYPLCAESGVRKRPLSPLALLTATICGSRLGSVAHSSRCWTQSTHIHRNGGGHSTRDGLRAHEKEVKNLRLLLSALSSDALSTPDEPAETNKKNTPHGTERETSMQKKNT